MMLQSPSLTTALEAVERVLKSDTGDLKELAKIAGVSPEALYFQADLSGIDLTDTDIDFLLPLQTHFTNAITTSDQRRAFRKASEQRYKQISREKIRDIRAQLVLRFIEYYESTKIQDIIATDESVLTPEFFREILLKPIIEIKNHSKLLKADYTNSALSAIEPWVSIENIKFLKDYFGLLGKIFAPTNLKTVIILSEGPFINIGDDLGLLIAVMHPTISVDLFWLKRSGRDQIIKAAKQIGLHRKVDANAIEKTLPELQWEELVSLFETVPFECDIERAERFSAHIVKQDWPSSETTRILEAKAHTKIRTALFRQIVGQGDQRRVGEVIRWLNGNKGAIGALSLENAFIHIRDFDVALKLASDLAPSLAANHIAVLEKALSSLAHTTGERSLLRSFRSKHGFK